MITEHLHQVMERLGKLPAPLQERYATEIEVDLDRAEAQEPSLERNPTHAVPEEPEEPETFPGYPVGVNPLEKYIGQLVDRFPDLSDDEVLTMEAAGDVPNDGAR